MEPSGGALWGAVCWEDKSVHQGDQSSLLLGLEGGDWRQRGEAEGPRGRKAWTESLPISH